MKRRQALRLGVRWVCAMALQGFAMRIEAAPWQLRRVPLSTDGWSGISLAADDAPQLLVAVDRDHRRRLQSLALRSAHEPLPLQPPQPLLELPGLLQWDARRTSAGWQVLSIHPGSGVAPLQLYAPTNTRPRPVDRHDQQGIFSSPRFAVDAADIVAIDLTRQYALTLYRPAGEGASGHAARQLLQAPRPGVLQAVQLLRWGGGWLLCVQRFVPGPMRRHGPGPSTEPQRSGRLDIQALNAQGQPQGVVWQPFGDRPIFEFAVAAAASRLAVVATTITGYALACGAPDEQGRGLALAADEPWPAELWSPCLQATPQRLRLALLEGGGGPVEPALLLAEMPWPMGAPVGR